MNYLGELLILVVIVVIAVVGYGLRQKI